MIVIFNNTAQYTCVACVMGMDNNNYNIMYMCAENDKAVSVDVEVGDEYLCGV